MGELPVRKNIRLKDYDYSQDGCYFITICVKDRKEIFWEKNTVVVGAASGRPIMVSGRPTLSKIGVLIETEIKKIETIYYCVKIDNYVIMPNHIHMIINISQIQDNSGRAEAVNGRPKADDGRPKAAPTISRIINQFKGSISKQIGFPIWQKLYYDHIVRNETDYSNIWQYIEENPLKWADDCYFVKTS